MACHPPHGSVRRCFPRLELDGRLRGEVVAGSRGKASEMTAVELRAAAKTAAAPSLAATMRVTARRHDAERNARYAKRWADDAEAARLSNAHR